MYTKYLTDSNLEIAGNLIQPVLVNTGLSTQQEARHLYQQAIIEVYDPDFCGLWQWVSCTAHKPMMVAPEEPDTNTESEPSGKESSDHRD